jgi:hypothetical protein
VVVIEGKYIAIMLSTLKVASVCDWIKVTNKIALVSSACAFNNSIFFVLIGGGVVEDDATGSKSSLFNHLLYSSDINLAFYLSVLRESSKMMPRAVCPVH